MKKDEARVGSEIDQMAVKMAASRAIIRSIIRQHEATVVSADLADFIIRRRKSIAV